MANYSGMGAPSNRSVYVCSLPPGTDEDMLAEYFGTIGLLKKDKRTGRPKIWLYRDKVTNEPKGDATVTYEAPYAAQAAVEWFNNKDFHGAIIEVLMAESKNSHNVVAPLVEPSLVDDVVDPEESAKDMSEGGGRGRGRGDAAGNAPAKAWQQDGDWMCPNTSRHTLTLSSPASVCSATPQPPSDLNHSHPHFLQLFTLPPSGLGFVSGLIMDVPPIDVDESEAVDQNQSQKSMLKVGDKRKSNVWYHYEDIRDPNTGNVVKAKCKYCSKLLNGCTKNGTSSLSKHLGSCPKYPANVDKKQMKISTFRTSQSDAATISNWEFDQNAIRLALAKMVILDEQPFSIVERDGFRGFCSAGMPQFCIPSRFTVARDCSKLFLSEREILSNTFKSLNSRIALTTDCWTSVQNYNYLCLTAHFIDDNWRLHKRILSFRLMDSHKGKEIGKVVESCVLQWGIEDKLSCLTVDNASSNDVAVAHLKDNLSEKLVLGGEFFHMRCAAHILNLIVKDGLNMVKDSINSIRGAVRYVRSSPARAKLFDECALKSKIPCKGSVCLDVPTRWNSTYIMLDLALKFEKAFKRMKQEDPDFVKELKDGFPSQQDWENAKALSLCLKQFYEATKRISGTLYVTANMHFHEILGVLASLLEWREDDEPSIMRMGEEMRKKFDKYYGGFGRTNVMVLVAVALDPRYKMRFVKFSLRKIFPSDSDKVSDIYGQVYDVLKKLYDHYANVSSSSKNDSSVFFANDDGDQNFVGTVNNKQMRKIYDEFYENDVGDAIEKSKLEEYLEAPPEKRDVEKFEILRWWSEKCTTYKVLGSMAKHILAIPVSTVASESAFSTSGRVVDEFRSSLGPKTVEALICAQDWLRGSSICLDMEQYLEDVQKYKEEIGRIDLDETFVSIN